jgi:hypothetical protein
MIQVKAKLEESEATGKDFIYVRVRIVSDDENRTSSWIYKKIRNPRREV